MLTVSFVCGCAGGPSGLMGGAGCGISGGCGDIGCTDPNCLGGLDDMSDPYSVSQIPGSGAVLPGCAAPEIMGQHVVSGPPMGIAANEGVVVSGPTCGQCQGNGCPGGCIQAIGSGARNALGALHGGGQARQPAHRPISRVPRELEKTTLPRHVIEAPDILLIEAVDNLRTEQSRLEAGDSLVVQVGQTVPVDPTEGRVDQLFKVINGVYAVAVDGYVDLGPEYGKVLLEGLTLDEARVRMEQHLRRTLKSPKLFLSFANQRTRQLIGGQHLVRPDGTVSLGIYGSVRVAGMTIDEARNRIENHLSPQIHRPRVAVDILAYNSKFYYVIADGGGAGEQVIKLPCTGNETVLDAIANIRGLPTVASKSDIWIARPAPAGTGADQRLAVDWNSIARGGITDTNYQLLPGDRLYVKADDLIVFDTWVAKLTAPWERIFGFAILGNGTVRALQVGRGAQAGGGAGGIGF